MSRPRFVRVMLRWPALLLVLCIGVAIAQEPAGTSRIVLLFMTASGDFHDLTGARIVESPAPLLEDPRPPDPSSIGYDVVDGDGASLMTGSVPDPSVVRSSLPQPGAPEASHETLTQPNVTYLLRLPYDPRMRYLRLAAGRAPQPLAAIDLRLAAGRRDSVRQGGATIDLEPWLVSIRPRD